MGETQCVQKSEHERTQSTSEITHLQLAGAASHLPVAALHSGPFCPLAPPSFCGGGSLLVADVHTLSRHMQDLALPTTCYSINLELVTPQVLAFGGAGLDLSEVQQKTRRNKADTQTGHDKKQGVCRTTVIPATPTSARRANTKKAPSRRAPYADHVPRHQILM